MINTFSFPAVGFFTNLDAAEQYVRSRSMDDVMSLTETLNESFQVKCGPIDSWSVLWGKAASNDISMNTVMYGRVSIAVIINSCGRRDWSVMLAGKDDCWDIEPVQAIAYILARFW